MSENGNTWKICSSCKKPINFNTKYWICSVSTCNQKRTGWVFCTVECWDAHVPKMNHRECWAVEQFSSRNNPNPIIDKNVNQDDDPAESGESMPPSKPKNRSVSASAPRTIIRRRG